MVKEKRERSIAHFLATMIVDTRELCRQKSSPAQSEPIGFNRQAQVSRFEGASISGVCLFLLLDYCWLALEEAPTKALLVLPHHYNYLCCCWGLNCVVSFKEN